MYASAACARTISVALSPSYRTSGGSVQASVCGSTYVRMNQRQGKCEGRKQRPHVLGRRGPAGMPSGRAFVGGRGGVLAGPGVRRVKSALRIRGRSCRARAALPDRRSSQNGYWGLRKRFFPRQMSQIRR